MYLPVDAAFLPTPMQLRVLHAVKGAGEADISALAASLFLTETGVRQHIGVLESAGLLESRADANNRPGRNRRVYLATAAADTYFPDNSPLQLWSLVRYLQQSHPEALAGWVDTWMEHRVGEVSTDFAGLSSIERAHAVAESASRRGAIVSVESATDEELALRIHHCPALTLARAEPAICEVERRIIERMEPGRTVTREAWKVEGSPYCHFRIAHPPGD